MIRRLAPLALCALLACARAPQGPPPAPIFYPLPPDAPRIQYLTSISSTGDLPRISTPLADFILGEEEGIGHLWKPYGVAMAGHRLFVCDTILNNVLIFDWDTGGVRPLSSNLGADTLRNPINIAVAPDGTKYVADALRGQVVVFGPDDRYLTGLGEVGQMSPCDVLIVDDLLLIADLEHDEIEVWDRLAGRPVRTIGGTGSEPGQFHGPTNLALAPDGTLWVSDTNSFRVQHLTLDGEVLGVFGEVGRSLGQFARPKGIAVDPEGRVYVVDAGFSNVQVFDDEGNLLMFFSGPGPDRSNLDLPAGIEILSDPEVLALFASFVAPGQRISHVILVTSQFGESRVNVYGFLAPPETDTDTRAATP